MGRFEQNGHFDESTVTSVDEYGRTSDEDLLRKFRAGDKEAFSELIERYRYVMTRYLYRFTGDTHESEDLFSDLCLTLMKVEHKFEVTRKFRPWFYALAGNKGIDFMRKGNSRRKILLEAEIRREASSADVSHNDFDGLDSIHDSEPETLALLISRESRDLVWEKVRELPSRQSVVIRQYLQEMEYDDIAREEGIPVGTVKSRLNGAKLRLRRMLSIDNL